MHLKKQFTVTIIIIFIGQEYYIMMHVHTYMLTTLQKYILCVYVYSLLSRKAHSWYTHSTQKDHTDISLHLYTTPNYEITPLQVNTYTIC